MKCTNCKRLYSPTDEYCPYCFTPNEELMQIGRTPTLRFSSLTTYQQQLSQTHGSISTSIMNIHESITIPFQRYSMLGAQQATTTVTLADTTTQSFSTANNMHSEMRAIDYMLNNRQWILFLGQVIKADHTDVRPDEFVTGEPHCGYCTIMLQVLGLPLSRPTKGSHQFASNLTYPLPEPIRKDKYVLARILDHMRYCGFNKIKQMLNAFVNTPPESWFLEVINGVCVNDYHYVNETQEIQLNKLKISLMTLLDREGVLDLIWNHIFMSINSVNN